MWDELADFDASEADAALTHLLNTLAALVSAQNAYWLGAVRIGRDDDRDPLRGWRPRIVRYLHSTDADQKFARQSIKEVARGGVDDSMIALARQAGTFRATSLRDLMPPEWFERGFYRDGIEPRGIVDTLHVVFPINDSTECYYGFHRMVPRTHFDAETRDVAAFALRGLKWFHRRVMLSHGLLAARTPLAPTERRVLHLLLTELSEKEVAARLKLTRATTHSYVTAILRKFGVTGRAGLTALWLGRPPSD